MNEQNYRFETLQLHAGQEHPDPLSGARAVPIYATTSYVFNDCAQAADRFALKEGGNIYGRLDNPTQEAFERRMAALEGGSSALALASGAAAVTYVLQALAQGHGHIVAQKTIYGGSYNLMAHTLPALGIETTFVNIHDLAETEAAIQPHTRLLYAETLGNPGSDIPDLDRLAEIAHRHGIPLVVDNTFATPYLLRPFTHGADIVVYSATKFIGGHGTALGGVIIESGQFDWAGSGRFPFLCTPNDSYHGVSFVQAAKDAALTTYIRAVLLRDGGACISPFAAFLLLQGTETLSLRPSAARRKYRFGRQVSGIASDGGKRQPPFSACASGSCALSALLSAWRRSYLHLRYPRRHRRSALLHRSSEAVFIVGQCGRCEEPGDPSGFDHPCAAA